MTAVEPGKGRRRWAALARRLGSERDHLREEVPRDRREPEASSPHEQHTTDDLSREQADAEVALAMLGNEEALLAECLAALERIERGKFGKCESCGRAIAMSRLDAAPYARDCIRCARTAEKQR